MALVLLVDDERDHLALAARHLVRGGHRVVTAMDADEAIQCVVDHGVPDVGVFDVRMPGATGFELTRRFQQFVAPAFPVIFLSSCSHPLDQAEGAVLGEAYVPKPAMRSQLLDEVDRVMQIAA